ncbi:MAG: hypothetical protein MI799_15435 [Desulfobacterales bacterium]|nr:hypothetical protein [Desulfobacterales bacterium]
MNKLTIAKKYFKYQRQDEATWQIGKILTKTVVEIPARSGSSRIKDKNIRKIFGLPLIGYTIRLAKSLCNVDRVIVNTDSREYADIAQSLGAEVPFLRPVELAKDDTPPNWSTFYLRRFLMDEDYPLKKLVTLMPTSPFRNKHLVERLISKLDTHYAVNTAYKINTSISSIYYPDMGGELQTLNKYNALDDKMFFIKKMGMFTGCNVITGSGLRTYVHLITSPVELIDIDTEQDIEAMKTILKYNLYDFGCAIC